MFCKTKSLHFLKTLSLSEKTSKKDFNLQSCLVAKIEKFKKSLDQGGEYAALLRDLPKAFHCLPHNLIIAKLHA